MDQDHIRAVLFPEGPGWIGQCLEHDICAQGATIHEADYNLRVTIAAERDFSRSLGRKPFEGIDPAPVEFFERFEKATGRYKPDDGSDADSEVDIKLAA